MLERTDPSQIFIAYYAGVTKFPYAPVTTNVLKDRYVGFLINALGEKWVFIYDADLGGGILTGNDCDWEIIPLGNAKMPVTNHVSLGEDETLWLQACWLASSYLRDGNKSEEVPWDVLTLGSAAVNWGISVRVLKQEATEGKLTAKRLGNLWITTISAMTKAHGPLKKDRRISREIGEESDKIQKEDTEEIRQKLMEKQS
jgi:hypothetical protein